MILYGGSGEGAPSLSVRPTDIQSQRMKGRKEKEKGRKNERAFTASFADDTRSGGIWILQEFTAQTVHQRKV